MPLPSSGQLSMSQINGEFGRGNNLNSYRGTQWWIGSTEGYFPSGQISFSDFYNKTPNAPAPVASMWTNNYGSYLYQYVEIIAPAYAYTYYQLRTYYLQNLGYVDALIADGWLDGAGNVFLSFGPISDEYWYPAPKENCFYIQLDNYGAFGHTCLYSS